MSSKKELRLWVEDQLHGILGAWQSIRMSLYFGHSLGISNHEVCFGVYVQVFRKRL